MPRAKNITHLLLDRLIENANKTSRQVAEELIADNASIRDIAEDLGLNSCSVQAKQNILQFIEGTGAGTYEPEYHRWQQPALEHEHYK